MEEPINESAKSNNHSKWGLVVTIIISAWLIGVSIVIAGWLISRQIAINNPDVSDTNPIPQTQHVDIEVPAGIPVLGDNNAKVTIIEFADFQCPFCGEWQKTVFPGIKSKYIDSGKARFVFMNYAFLGEESNKAAEAARCAQDQGKFWEYHDELYQNQKGENEGAFTDANLKTFAKNIKLNETEFNTCFDSRKYQQEIIDDLDKGTAYSVQSTPTVFINGNKYEGILSLTSYASIIDAELEAESEK